MKNELIQVKTDEETKTQFIEASKKLKISLSDFIRLSAVEKINREARISN